MSQGLCRLCQKQTDLQNSHIIPAFVFRWMRESSGLGLIRYGREPNRRVQGGPTRPWFCAECEGRLNRSETEFATRLFHPYISGSCTTFHYARWLMHFCTSISWRGLVRFLEENRFEADDATVVAHVVSAERAWRDVLLDVTPNPGKFEQHFLPLGEIDIAPGSTLDVATIEPNINRYLNRVVDQTFIRAGDALYVYTKFSRFIILGFVHDVNANHWRGTKVHRKKGVIKPRRYVLPKEFFEFLNDRARNARSIAQSLSERQKMKATDSFRQNMDQFVLSDAFRVLKADVSAFGERAFINRRRQEEENPDGDSE